MFSMINVRSFPPVIVVDILCNTTEQSKAFKAAEIFRLHRLLLEGKYVGD